jgi:sugar fermentation stimulation protein A
MVPAMKFDAPLIPGRLVRRYKRFLADVELGDGTLVTAHCANPGSMIGLVEPGTEVWLSESTNPSRKLKFNWELLRVDMGSGPAMVGINTSHPNRIVADAIRDGGIAELAGYAGLRREVKYGRNSRIDILLEDEARPPCYVEVKNVHLLRSGTRAEFPDSVTARGAKHLDELAAMAEGGARAVMMFLVQRDDAMELALAGDIDPHYVERFKAATAAGVETLVYCCRLSEHEIAVHRRLPLVF